MVSAFDWGSKGRRFESAHPDLWPGVRRDAPPDAWSCPNPRWFTRWTPHPWAGWMVVQAGEIVAGQGQCGASRARRLWREWVTRPRRGRPVWGVGSVWSAVGDRMGVRALVPRSRSLDALGSWSERGPARRAPGARGCCPWPSEGLGAARWDRSSLQLVPQGAFTRRSGRLVHAVSTA